MASAKYTMTCMKIYNTVCRHSIPVDSKTIFHLNLSFCTCSKQKYSVTRWTEQMSRKVGGACVWAGTLENCMWWDIWWWGSSSCLQTAGLSSRRSYTKTCLRVSCMKLCFTLYDLPYEITSKRFTQQEIHTTFQTVWTATNRTVC